MSHGIRTFVLLAIAMALLVPVASGQKPPAPAPAPSPSPTPGRTAAPSPTNSDPTQPTDDLVMFLRGRVAIHDGAPVPQDMLIERVCNNRVRQEVYASSQGDFSMQLGSRTDSFPEASADPGSLYAPYGGTRRDTSMGIPRRELTNCELRASAPGFRSSVVSLMDLDTFGGNANVGVIVMQRGAKTEGSTLSAIPYKAPKDARGAYEKGLQAAKKGKLADAQKYFETSVRLYPASANAWFQLGAVLQKESQKDAARKAYTQATTVDTKFLPPYLSLAALAYEAGNWNEVRDFTGHILDLDPFNRAAATGYFLDLDAFSYGDAYFYNAMANFNLNKIEDAEKSALKAEHLDLRPHFPRLHLLLAEIFARKNDYAMAIAQIQTYLELVPHAKDADQIRERLAELEKLDGSASTTGKPN